jgi:hypothetical protein
VEQILVIGIKRIVNQPNPFMPAGSNGFRRAKNFALLWSLSLAAVALPVHAAAEFVRVDPANTTNGYLARLLINEAPFPGEYDYISENDARNAMLQILWVLHSRIQFIPDRYQQQWIAGVRSTDIIDIITGTSDRPQCEGFYRDARGRFVTSPRVNERFNYLLKIANSGGKPGRFAGLLNYAQGLATAYVNGGIEGADRYAGITKIGSIKVTGRAYSWMTDLDRYNPGGNFVSIPNEYDGSLGGNRFFTLRKFPQ